MSRLRFMSQSNIPKDVLKGYAKPQKEWWQKAGIVDHPTIPAWCRGGGKQTTTDVKEWHYHLCAVLCADARAFLAALAEYDRICEAAEKELLGFTDEECQRVCHLGRGR